MVRDTLALTRRWTDRLASMTVVRLVVWVAIAAWVYQGILSDPFKLTDWMDDHQFYSWEQSDRMTLMRWGQLPAWNPYWCGGTPGIAAPEDSFLSPDFLLRLVFGVAHGRRLAIMLLLIAGFEGTFRLCRRLDCSVVASAFAAVIFGTCDRFVMFLHDGWINFLGFELVPWVVLCFLNGLQSWRWRLLGGFFFAWMVLNAGTYPPPYTVVVLGYLTVFLSIRAAIHGERRAWLAPWKSGATIGLVALGLAAGKLIPTVALLSQFPRHFTPVETHGAPELFAPFFYRYGVVLVIGLIGVVLADTTAALFCGGVVLTFALAMGDTGPWSAFHLLKALPMFSQLRFPDRYTVLILFFLVVCAARGITRVEDALPRLVRGLWDRWFAWRKRPARPLPVEIGIVMVGVATLLAYAVLRPQAETVVENGRIKTGTMMLQEAPREYEQPFRQSRGNRRDAHIFTTANLGSIYCVAGTPLPQSALLRGALPQEEYPSDPTKATVTRKSWSPNVIELDVDAKEATTIYVNQNWAPQWQSSVGTVKDHEKLLAVDVPAGKYTMELAYRDRLLTVCLLLSLATLLGVLYAFGRSGWQWLQAERVRWRTLPTWPDEEARPAEVDDAEEEPKDEPPPSPPPVET
ncbi:MAG: hypothetical protein JWO86_157 [Myxococcaceae bacterium]|nr:hypothetical protein [Myxococcaceae bacterium]